MKITQIPMGAHNAQLTCYRRIPAPKCPLWTAVLRS